MLVVVLQLGSVANGLVRAAAVGIDEVALLVLVAIFSVDSGTHPIGLLSILHSIRSAREAIEFIRGSRKSVDRRHAVLFVVDEAVTVGIHGAVVVGRIAAPTAHVARGAVEDDLHGDRRAVVVVHQVGVAAKGGGHAAGDEVRVEVGLGQRAAQRSRGRQRRRGRGAEGSDGGREQRHRHLHRIEGAEVLGIGKVVHGLDAEHVERRLVVASDLIINRSEIGRLLLFLGGLFLGGRLGRLFPIGALVGLVGCRLVGGLLLVGRLVGGLGLRLRLGGGRLREGDRLRAQVAHEGELLVGQRVVHRLGTFHLLLLDGLGRLVGPQHEGRLFGVVGRAVLGLGEIGGGVGHGDVQHAGSVHGAGHGIQGERVALLGRKRDVGHAVFGHRHLSQAAAERLDGRRVGRVHAGELLVGQIRRVEGHDGVGGKLALALGRVGQVAHAQGVAVLGHGAEGRLQREGERSETALGIHHRLAGRREGGVEGRLGRGIDERGGGGGRIGVVHAEVVALGGTVLIGGGRVGAQGEAGIHRHLLGGGHGLGEPHKAAGQLGAGGHLAARLADRDAVLVLHAFVAQHDGAGKTGGELLGGALLVLLAVLGEHGPAGRQRRDREQRAHVVGSGAAGLPLLFRKRGAVGSVGFLVQEGSLERENDGVVALGAAQVSAVEGDVRVAERGGDGEVRAAYVVGVVRGAQGVRNREREREAVGEGGLEVVLGGGGRRQDAVLFLLQGSVGERRHDLLGIEEILGQICLHICLADGIVSGRVVGVLSTRGIVALGGIALALDVVGRLVDVLVVHLVEQLVAGARRRHGYGVVADDHAAGLLDGVAVPAGQHQQHRQHHGNGLAHGVQLARGVVADDAGRGALVVGCRRNSRGNLRSVEGAGCGRLGVLVAIFAAFVHVAHVLSRLASRP